MSITTKAPSLSGTMRVMDEQSGEQVAAFPWTKGDEDFPLVVAQAEAVRIGYEHARKKYHDAEALDLLDDVSAALENVLLHHGDDMTPGDRAQRQALVKRARELCDQALRSDERTED
jgi:hypothetical protein